MSRKDIETLSQLLRGASSAAIVAHVSPDMDTLGASLGVMYLLRQGFPALRRVDVFCQDPVPEADAFLPAMACVRKPEEAKDRYDLCIAVDVAAYDRMGSCAAIYDRAGTRFVIDHHGSNNFENVPMLLEPHTPASSQIVVDLYEYFGLTIPKEAAMCLYAGISTDTGNFSYQGVSPATFRAAARLVEAGAEPDYLTAMLYRTRSLPSVRCLGRALESLQLSLDGRVAVMHLSFADRKQLGVQNGDTEGVVNYGIEIKSVRAAALLNQHEDCIRCSVRTKEGVDAAAIARRFGGGGHPRAAGMTLVGKDLAQALLSVQRALEEAVKACPTDS